MKYLFASLVLALGLLAFPAFAQQPDTVQVDVTKLSQEQLRVWQELKKQQAESSTKLSVDSLTPEKIDKYAQMGKGLGIAINEGLKAVTQNVEQFAQTSAGKWIMVLVTWKVMGEDATQLVSRFVRFIVGGSLLLIGVPFFAYIYRRNCVSVPLCVSKTKIGFLTVKKEFQGMTKPIHDDAGPWGYAVCFAVFLGIVVLIMFV
jgi:hypothetical protein